MAGKGAPEGNQYAKKEDTGRTISLYLSAEDMKLLHYVLEQHHLDSSDAACVVLARQAAKSGINSLLLPRKYQTMVDMYLQGARGRHE